MINWAIIVHDLRRERGERQHEFARAVGVSQATVSRWEKGHNKPSRDEVRALEGLAGRRLEPAGEDLQGTSRPGPPQPAGNLVRTEHLPPPGTDPLAILGFVQGGSDGLFLDNGAAQGYTARPDFLVGATQAYAVFVHDSSMEPRYFHGEMLYVDPSVPARPGDFVVIQTADDRAFIKRLRRLGADHIVAEQFNPVMELVFPATGSRVHSIVGTRSVRR